MIGTLARKRTNWAALAVLAALAVALLAATISSQTTGPRITSTTDSDFIIADGGNITVSVTDAGAATYTLQPVFGFVLTGTVAGGPATYTHQSGGPQGAFTIRATSPGIPALEKTLTVGEAGDNLAAVNVNLGTTLADGTGRGTAATATTDVAETDKAVLGTVIYIEVEALNSLGNATNIAADPADMDVSVFAVGGTVAAGDTAGTGSNATGNSADPAAATPNIIDFVVSRAIAAGAGTVEVFAVATIGTTSVRSESLTLTFTAVAGNPAIVSVEDGGTVGQGVASVALEDDESTAIDPAEAATRATLSVSATDADGNDATLVADTIAATGLKVTGPDDKDVTDNGIANVAVARYDLDTADATGNQSGIVVTLADDAAPGVYTVEVTLGTSKDTATFTVTGSPTNVEVVIEAADGTGLGEQLTATATVTDTNGNLVAPIDVAFTVAQGAPATFVGVDSKTKDGVASRSAVITGSGVITVIATAGGVSGVDVIRAGDGAGAGAADDEVGVDCLTNLAGHSVWTCATSGQASAIFTDLAAAGATTLWLHNGSRWVPYAVRDGVALPGADNDFAIRQFANLYISQ